MKRRLTIVGTILMGVVLFTAGMQAQQSGWFMTFKPAFGTLSL